MKYKHRYTEVPPGPSYHPIGQDSRPGFPDNQNYVVVTRPAFIGEYEFLFTGSGWKQWNDCSHGHHKLRIINENCAKAGPNSETGYWTWPNAALIPNEYDAFKPTDFPSWTQIGQHANPFLVYAGDAADDTLVIVPSAVVEAANRIANDIGPEIRSNMSLVNSVIELSDFKSLPDTVTKCRDLLGSAGGFLREVSKVFTGKPDWTVRTRAELDKLTRTLKKGKVDSDVYLTWMFAFKPLISDVVAIQRSLNVLRRDVERLIANERKYRVAHRSRQLHGIYGNMDRVSESSCDVWGPSKWDITVTHPVCELHVTMAYAYHLNGLSRFGVALNVLLDSLGVNLNPAILWNATRWTFVIDWLLKVGTFLDQFKRTALDPSVVIYNCCYSFKVVRETRLRCLGLQQKGPLPIVTTVMAEAVDKGYLRRNFRPSLNSLTTSGLSLTEASLAGALVRSKWRSPYNSRFVRNRGG